MGWTLTGDPYVNVGEAGLEFDSEEAAKAFAEKYGWEYQVSLMKSENIWSCSILLFSTIHASTNNSINLPFCFK